MRTFTITIPAGGSDVETYHASVVSVKSCTLPLAISFDGADSQQIKAGMVIDRRPNGFAWFNLVNPQAVAVTVVLIAGDTPVQFQPDDSSGSNAQTYALGNFGIANGAQAGGGNPACDANGYLQVTNGMGYAVPGTNNGHRRQIITFTVNVNSPAPLQVLDANGCVVMNILAGQSIALVTDAAFVISGQGGTAQVTIGQIFLSV